MTDDDLKLALAALLLRYPKSSIQITREELDRAQGFVLEATDFGARVRITVSLPKRGHPSSDPRT